MPYLFDSLEEFRALVDAMWDQNNEWAVKEGGGRLLCILDVGYRQLTTNARHPVRKLADARGIKIRTPQNALMVSTFKALGLEPTAVSFAETFNALQQGVVDGQEGCFNNVVTLKFYEAQKYASQINYSVHSCNFVASERWLQSLPEQARSAARPGPSAMTSSATATPPRARPSSISCWPKRPNSPKNRRDCRACPGFPPRRVEARPAATVSATRRFSTPPFPGGI